MPSRYLRAVGGLPLLIIALATVLAGRLGAQCPDGLLAAQLHALRHFDAQADDVEIAHALQVVRERGASVPAARGLLTELLAEDHCIYRGRGPREIARLRPYVFACLAAMEAPPAGAVPYCLAALRLESQPLMVGAAARLAGKLPRFGGALVPELRRFLKGGFRDDHFSLEDYNPRWPLEHPTTARLEVVHALRRIGKGAQPALVDLGAIAEADVPLEHWQSPELVRAAQRAVAVIERDLPLCCRRPGKGSGGEAPALTTWAKGKWLPLSARCTVPELAVAVMDQTGQTYRFEELLTGQPTVLSFFYTRCENPNKCSMTIQYLGRLQRKLRESGLLPWVKVLAVTFDPDYDVPHRLYRFGEARGFQFGPHGKMLRNLEGSVEELTDRLGVPVAYGHGQVGLHALQLLILDREGCIARIYQNTIWDQADVIADLRRLLGEVG